MIAHKPLMTPLGILSFLLGNASALWGFLVAPIYAIAFGLLRSGAVSGVDVAGMVLPLEVPVIGLALGVLGLLLALPCREPTVRLCLAGMLLNAIPLALAGVWMYQHVFP